MGTIFQKRRLVFYLAALADIVPSIQRPEAYFKANVTGTFNHLGLNSPPLAANKYNANSFRYPVRLRRGASLSFVQELPQGIDTEVGDRGVRLSGGQRQRIALARALPRKPELLILDEATSALDSESEKLIQQSIEQVANETTILIVAHRISTVAKADKIYVIKQGMVVEEGSFNELSKKPGGILYNMIMVQQPLQLK